MKRKSILFVVQGLSRGGTEWTLIEALNSLDYNKNEVSLYIRKNMLDLIEFVNPNVKIIKNDVTETHNRDLIDQILDFFANILIRVRVDSIGKRILNINRKRTLRRRITKEKNKYFKKDLYDIAVSYDMANDCANFVKSINAREKYVFFHGSTMDFNKYSIYCDFDKIITVNHLVKEKLMKMYPLYKGEVEVIENYAEVSKIRRYMHNNITANSKLVLCSCGRMTKEKGFLLAVDTAKIIRDKGIEFVWYFVGEGYEKNLIEKKIESYGLHKNIILTGFQNNPYKYMLDCDIYVQPSLEESYGMTILESIILCKPTVSTATLGGIYLFEKFNTITLTEINSVSLANGIVDLYKDIDKREHIINKQRDIDWHLERKNYEKKIKKLFN